MSEMTACIRAEIWRMRNNQRFFEANTVQEETDALEEQIATLTEDLDAARGVLAECTKDRDEYRTALADLRIENNTKDVAAERFFTALDALEDYKGGATADSAMEMADELIDSRDCLRRVFNFSEMEG